MEWELVIGLEVHAQLSSKSKIFSGSSTQYGAEPNTQASIIDLGYPGVLPVLNKAVVDMACMFGLAINAEVAKFSAFDRKNYFYPDLPKGYQISQFYHPIVKNGYLDIQCENNTKRINIERAHLEEDAGKSLHEDFMGFSGIDLNRAGTPLLEIVTAPEISSSTEAVAYLKTLHTLLRYLDICDGNMQEGSFRCDANISVKPKGETKLGTRVEVKNLNSFKFIEKAINHEAKRQIALIESGNSVSQETRLYDVNKDATRIMRDKETANDYRYFPDPDLPPVILTEDYISKIKEQLPELPKEKAYRFQSEYGLSEYESQVLTATRELATFYEKVILNCKDTKLAATWVMGDFLAIINKNNFSISSSPVNAEALAVLLNRISDNTISGKIAKDVLTIMFESGKSADEVIKEKDLNQVTDSNAILEIVKQVVDANPNQVSQYKEGKTKLFGFFVGQVMKVSKGKANPSQVNEILKQLLDG